MEDTGETLDGWPKRRGPGYLAVVMISVLVSALAVVGAQFALVRWPDLQVALGGRSDADRAKVGIPGVTKIPLEAAGGLLDARGLKLLSVGSASDPEVPAGWIVWQTPAPGTKVRRGRTVRVKLSSGPPLVPVPPIVGAGFAEAQQLLLQSGLRLGSVETTGAALRVTGTRPAPGEQAASGAPVTLILEVVPPAGADADAQDASAAPARRGGRGR